MTGTVVVVNGNVYTIKVQTQTRAIETINVTLENANLVVGDTITVEGEIKKENNAVVFATGASVTVNDKVHIEKVIANGTYMIKYNGFAMHALVNTDKDYGYHQSTDVSKNTYRETNVFTITNVDGGVLIQDFYGRYLYATSEYRQITVSATLPDDNSAYIWKVMDDREGNIYLLHVATNRTLAFDTTNNYNSWGAFKASERTDKMFTNVSITAQTLKWAVVGSVTDFGWDPANGVQLVETGVAGILRTQNAYQFGSRDQIKIVVNGSWGINYGLEGFDGNNVYAEIAGKYYVQFNIHTYEITLIPADASSMIEKTWTVVGGMNSWKVDGGAELVVTDDIHILKTKEAFELAADAEFKVVLNGSCDISYGGKYWDPVDGGNYIVETAGRYYILFNTRTHKITLEVAPEVGKVDAYEKVTADQTDWSGTYLLGYVDGEGNIKIFNYEGEGGEGNYINVKGVGAYIEAKADVKAIVVVIEKTDGGYFIKFPQKKTEMYMGGKANQNGITFSDTGILNTITYEDGVLRIVSNGVTLRFNANSSGGNRFRYYKTTVKDDRTGYSLITLFKTTQVPEGTFETSGETTEQKYGDEYGYVVIKENNVLDYFNGNTLYQNVTYTAVEGQTYFQFADPSDPSYSITFCVDGDVLKIDIWGGTDWAEWNKAVSIPEADQGTYKNNAGDGILVIKGTTVDFTTPEGPNGTELKISRLANGHYSFYANDGYTYEFYIENGVLKIDMTGEGEFETWNKAAADEKTPVFTEKQAGYYSFIAYEADGETLKQVYSIRINQDGSFEFNTTISADNWAKCEVKGDGYYVFNHNGVDYAIALSADGQTITLSTAGQEPVILALDNVRA